LNPVQVAGFLPDDIVERALKQLLVLVRDAPNVGLLIIDVSQRSEWAQGNLKPSGVDFLNKFNKDRRENVRVCIMDASTDGSSAVPGVNIESLPATMVFQVKFRHLRSFAENSHAQLQHPPLPPPPPPSPCHQSSIINHQSSIINHQSSIINHQ